MTTLAVPAAVTGALGGPGGTHPGVAETHSAVVFFVGDRAYKLKKPVDLGFLDFRSREAREAVSHREVELNRRLSPDVYLGVADVHGPDGAVCDHLVVMRRMPGDRRLSSLVREGVPVGGHLWRVAHTLAAFHARSPRSVAADDATGIDATRGRWNTNTKGLLGVGGRALDEAAVEVLHRLATRYLDGREPLFARRVSDGRGVDGHGDLLADDIFCLDDGPRILDCIEFDDRLRLGDGLADAAFLAMDLERLGRPDLGADFLEAYREHRNDTWPASLAHHHIAYRAMVRAKVGAIRAGQGTPGVAAEARRLLGLAATHLEAARVRLVLVGGLPGTGKSTLSEGLASAIGATALRSDEIRKELFAGPAAGSGADAFGEGYYTEAATVATYATLLDRAEVALGMGETVVLDASWTSDRRRAQARALAARVHADVVELSCEAPRMVAAARIVHRRSGAPQPSDATPEIADAMRATTDPWPRAAAIDTAFDRAHALALALQRVQQPVAWFDHLRPGG